MSGFRPGIKADGVWKRFRRGEHDALRDLIPAMARSLLGRGSGGDRQKDEFWALRDVSLSVDPGQVLGIIGPNGAGKSTLLKLLTGIYQPTRGKVRVRGKVGALIEVAAGFHEDLTGRENVFLQGAVMGLGRAEVARRFDEIVEFSGVGEFIDTPVKRYSSGMRARLGFAVAAHMDPDVLLVDEVLAVGDLEFQARAAQRLRQLMERDVPVVLVSHQLDRITGTCTEAILMVQGQVLFAGPPEDCVEAYLGSHQASGSIDGSPAPVRVTSIDGIPARAQVGEEVRIRIRGEVVDPSADQGAAVGIRVRAVRGDEVIFATSLPDFGLSLPPSGRFAAELRLRLHLLPGLFRVQGVVWRKRDAMELARGPSALVEVEGKAPARGWAHLEPRMRPLDP